MNIATILAIVQVVLALLKTAPLLKDEAVAIHDLLAKIRSGQQPTPEEQAAFWQTLLKIVTQLAGAALPAAKT